MREKEINSMEWINRNKKNKIETLGTESIDTVDKNK